MKPGDRIRLCDHVSGLMLSNHCIGEDDIISILAGSREGTLLSGPPLNKVKFDDATRDWAFNEAWLEPAVAMPILIEDTRPYLEAITQPLS